MKKNEITNLTIDMENIKPHPHIVGLFVNKDGSVYQQLNGKMYKLNQYTNNCNGWKNGYVKVHIIGENAQTLNLHRLLAETFVPMPEYLIGNENAVVDHIDNNSLNNSIDNLQWTTRGKNVIKYWDDLKTNEAEYNEYIKTYSEGIREAHKKGKYKNHLDNVHKQLTGKKRGA